MSRSRLLPLAAVAVIGGVVAVPAGPAHAGPCTQKIAQVEERIREVQAVSPPGGAGAPSAPQTIGAQLHHQPTAQSVENAESRAKADAAAAIDRARIADAKGDATACAAAIQDAKDLYGIE